MTFCGCAASHHLVSAKKATATKSATLRLCQELSTLNIYVEPQMDSENEANRHVSLAMPGIQLRTFRR